MDSDDKTKIELRVDGRAIGGAAGEAVRLGGGIPSFDPAAHNKRKREEATIRAAYEFAQAAAYILTGEFVKAAEAFERAAQWLDRALEGKGG